jgi:hypothetical protein
MVLASSFKLGCAIISVGRILDDTAAREAPAAGRSEAARHSEAPCSLPLAFGAWP